MSTIVMNELKNFDIHLEHEGPSGITITELLIEEKCLSFLQKQMIEIKAPNLSVTASMLSKRYAYLVVSSTLYSMVEFNCALHLPVKACALTKERKLCIQASMCNWQEIKSMDREPWRENVLRALFSSHITPVLEILKKTSRVPSSILWENVAIRINSIYRKTLAKEVDLVKIERLNSDFNFLKNASGDLFNLRENPIKEYLKIGEEHKVNPCRKTCCLYYKLEEDREGIGYCGNCPIRSKKEKRGELLQ
ncbi:IucA/IucC family C-terminal-domain containing protein [Sporosarcina sp. JAI121]|uniref:IucA/IucC family C-terminal-domain containing protein n=1 Tax=Sporosarcina sp. JAI121 TaxID=2723064 RepID=UPI0015C74859|nr:IucA/IucC family C-terminal-domain containing protein [Sporosarcina sp. JAI121]NYF26107.1 ferric iron reductase protein FhuF [Sporosarcina sp. JAI121]